MQNKIYQIYENIIFYCLLLYGLTFLIDTKINFVTTAFILNIIFLFYFRKNHPLQLNYTKEFKYYIYIIIYFLLMIFLSTILSDGSLHNYKSRFISPLLGLFTIILFPMNIKRIFLLFLSFSIPLLINALLIIYQFYLGNTGRPTGFCNNHYMFLAVSNSLILPIILTLSLHKSQLSKKIRILLFFIILINIPAVIFENTRIVWLELAIIFPLIILFSIKSKLKAISLIILLAVYSLSIFSISPSSINRVSSIPDTNYANQSNYERILMWESATKMFIDHPVSGVGLGNYYEEYMSTYRSPLSRETQGHPHNVLLAFLSETGLLGTSGYILLFIYLYYYTITNYIRNKDAFSLAFLSCLLAFTINSLTDSIFCQLGYKGNTALFWIFTGLYFILNKHLTISKINN